ncbi:ankyrin repeat domain-containing protein [Variovorax sp. W2I14]|uniref:ankyrin repeat domain-containing protein n=1 Tax=Variovorax sp. W2I14 TaxID=3042290 RepID=UPI003D1AB03A
MKNIQDYVAQAYEDAKAGRWAELLDVWATSPILLARCSRYSKPSSSWTFLHQAAHFGNEPGCKVLIGKGANLEARDKKSRTPADVAKQQGHLEVERLLRAAEVDRLWEPSSDPDVLPSSSRWREATATLASTDIYVAYGGATVRIPMGTPHFIDSLSRILVGWHGTFNPPRGMDGESMLS